MVKGFVCLAVFLTYTSVVQDEVTYPRVDAAYKQIGPVFENARGCNETAILLQVRMNVEATCWAVDEKGDLIARPDGKVEVIGPTWNEGPDVVIETRKR